MLKINWKTIKVKISKLIPHAKNPRKLSKEQEVQLTKSIKKFSLAEIPVVNRDFTILAGHQRLMVMKKLGRGEEEIDVRFPNRQLTDKEADEYLIRSNKNSGEFDLDLLAEHFDIDDLLDFGFDELELESIIDDSPGGATDDDDVPEPSKVAVSKLGDLYQLGEHRLLCGDSTDIKHVERLMDGKKADMVFTDPPYGMHLDTDWSSAKSSLKFAKEKNALGGKKHKRVIGDHEDFTPELINTVFRSFSYCKEIFLWGADYYAELLEDKNGGSWVVWDKRLDESADKMYGSCFELCWSKNKHKREIARVKWAGIFGTEQEFDHKRHHPTQKPTGLVEWFFDKWGNGIDLVADLFGGSGSTLIACEKTKRKCRMMELDPIYIDVIIKRWEEYTGEKAKLLN